MLSVTTTCSGVYTDDDPVTPVGVTKVLDTVRKYLNMRANPSECACEANCEGMTTDMTTE